MTDLVVLLAEIQAYVLRTRQMAAETKDPRKRDACLRVADEIEKRARELDQSN